MKKSRRTPLEAVEDLATERLGRGSAISVDRAGSYYVVTAWSPDGEVREVSIVGKKEVAIADLRRRLVASYLKPEA